MKKQSLLLFAALAVDQDVDRIGTELATVAAQ